MKIYHGSSNLIRQPPFGIGKAGNDFGLGLYCTESEDLAKEWSVQPNRDGFANAYEIDLSGLNVLRLNTPTFTVLNWMAILVAHRQFKLKVPVACADHTLYYPRRQSRNETAAAAFNALLGKGDFRGLYMNVILSEQIGNDDARIPRNTLA